jgi:hypothetical protein
MHCAKNLTVARLTSRCHEGFSFLVGMIELPRDWLLTDVFHDGMLRSELQVQPIGFYVIDIPPAEVGKAASNSRSSSNIDSRPFFSARSRASGSIRETIAPR